MAEKIVPLVGKLLYRASLYTWSRVRTLLPPRGATRYGMHSGSIPEIEVQRSKLSHGEGGGARHGLVHVTQRRADSSGQDGGRREDE